MDTNFYVYGYIRENTSKTTPAGTFYYIGKGRGKRAYSIKHGRTPVPKDRKFIVIIAENLTESRAFEFERKLIEKYGRKDLGNGILINKTDGGEGQSGRIMSIEGRKRISDSRMGKPLGKQSEIHIKRKTGARDSNKGKFLNKNTNEIYENMADFLLKTGLSKDSSDGIRRVLRGARKTYKGYSLEYIGSNKKEFIPKKRVSKYKPVMCIEKNLTFDNTKDAVEWLKTIGFNKSCSTAIKRCCDNLYKRVYGYTWTWIDLSRLL